MRDRNLKTSDVITLYSQFPYPPLSWGLPINWKFLLGRYVEKASRILDAGCGTGTVIAEIARAYPEKEFFGIDVTTKSIEIANTEFNHVRNLKYLEGNLLNDLSFLGKFDLILSLGVIHHLKNPLLGIKNLISIVNPGGTIIFFLYALYGRQKIEFIRHIMQIMDKLSPLPENLKLAQKLHRYFFRSKLNIIKNILRKLIRIKMDNLDIRDADAYLHPIVHNYTISSLIDLLDQAGLELIEFINGYPWNLYDDIERIPIEELRHKAHSLNRMERWQLLEIFQQPINFTFSCQLKV
jgi:SAM-dependent methyltransferase